MICKNGYKIEFDYNNKMYCCMGCEEWFVKGAKLIGLLWLVTYKKLIVIGVIFLLIIVLFVDIIWGVIKWFVNAAIRKKQTVIIGIVGVNIKLLSNGFVWSVNNG